MSVNIEYMLLNFHPVLIILHQDTIDILWHFSFAQLSNLDNFIEQDVVYMLYIFLIS